MAPVVPAAWGPKARKWPLRAGVRHHRRVPPLPSSGPSEPDADGASEACPGCGAVLASLPDTVPGHPGASASCSRLFEVTVRGLREEAQADPSAAPLVRLADAAYDAQHPVPGDPARLEAALAGLAGMLGTRPTASGRTPARPRVWRTTIADAAADLDVIDLPALVESWSRTVHEDWAAAASPGP
jgi:Family of unknown function (DUF5946)